VGPGVHRQVLGVQEGMCHKQKVLVEMAPALEVHEVEVLVGPGEHSQVLGVPEGMCHKQKVLVEMAPALKVLEGRMQGSVGSGAGNLQWERQTDAVGEPGLLEGADFGPGHRK
jgi:hypothetical protein